MCQKLKKVTSARSKLHPIPVKSPWHHVGTDFIGPLNPPSRWGNRYIFTLIDYFMKFAWAKETANKPTKEAENVVEALKDLRYILYIVYAWHSHKCNVVYL